MAIEFNDTLALVQTAERIKPPATFLLDTFFPNIPAVTASNKIPVEYRKGGRRLAPFVVRGSKGVNMGREGSTIDFYKPPMMAPRRVLDPEDIQTRSFGENIVSTMTPAQRAAQMQAKDISELQEMIINRKNKMAADILTTGKCDIKGLADDGKTELIDTVTYDWTQKITPTTSWDAAGATIYYDFENASQLIQESSGMVPSIAIVGKNVPKYMLGNDQIMKYLAIPNANNLSLMSLQPRITSPQVSRVGMIQSLNLEIYSYMETYTDDDGNVVPFLGEDDVIIANPGRGKQLHGAVTLVNQAGTGYDTYIAPYVPYYDGDRRSQEVALTVYSRCLLTPEFVDDWALIKAKG